MVSLVPNTSKSFVHNHFFQNVTSFGNRTWDAIESNYLSVFRSASFVEHHLDPTKLSEVCAKLGHFNFHAAGSSAVYTQRSKHGTSGGAMSLVAKGYKAWMPSEPCDDSQVDPTLFQGL